MRNVTISLDDDVARWARVEAAKADVSLSRWIGQLLEQQAQRQHTYDAAHASYAARSAQTLKAPGDRYPARDDVHARP